MFEINIEATKTKLFSHIDLSSEHVLTEDLLSNPHIHPAYKSYLEAEREWWIYEERLLRESNINFDTSNAEIQSIFFQLDKAYKTSAQMDADDLDIVLSSAIEARLNFLIRPRTALKWFIFRAEPTKTYGEILKRLNYLSDYSYLIDKLKDHIQSKIAAKSENAVSSVFEFERISEKIDKTTVFSMSPEGFADLCDPMFEFFSLETEVNELSEVPAEALIIFLDDKGLAEVALRLEHKCKDDKLIMISKSYFLDFINTILSDDYIAAEPAPVSTSKNETTQPTDYIYTVDPDKFVSKEYINKLFEKILGAFHQAEFPDEEYEFQTPVFDKTGDEPEISGSDSELQDNDSNLAEDMISDSTTEYDQTDMLDEFPNASYTTDTDEATAEVDIEEMHEEINNTANGLDEETVDEILDAVDVSQEVIEEENDFSEFAESDFEELVAEEFPEEDTVNTEIPDNLSEIEETTDDSDDAELTSLYGITDGEETEPIEDTPDILPEASTEINTEHSEADYEDMSRNFNDEIDSIIAGMEKLAPTETLPPDQAEPDSTLLSEYESKKSVTIDNGVSNDILNKNFSDSYDD